MLSEIRRLANRFALWRRSVGLASASSRQLLGLRRKLGLPEPETWSVHPRQVQHALTARLGGSSDLWVFNQIFILGEYAFLSDLKDASLVLDLGANAGFSAALFLNLFPKARVISVEPDDRNVAICRRNLAPYGDRARVLHGAAWSTTMRLQLSTGDYGDGREWATQVREASGREEASGVQAWDVASLMEMAGGGMVDLLKVDIERAELEVFGSSAEAWLPRVRNICIELHGKDCEDRFFAALAGFDYELSWSGELTVCRNLRRKAASKESTGQERSNVLQAEPYAR